MRRLVISVGSFGLALLAACSGAPETSTETVAAPPVSETVGEGQAIAETLCSGCHSIGEMGMSPHPDAKPFRNFSENYPVRGLEEALAEGILVGHPDMPVWQFEPDEVEALIQYLESIQAPKNI